MDIQSVSAGSHPSLWQQEVEMWLCWLPVLMEALMSVSQHCGARRRGEFFFSFSSQQHVYLSLRQKLFPLNKSKLAIKQLSTNKANCSGVFLNQTHTVNISSLNHTLYCCSYQINNICTVHIISNRPIYYWLYCFPTGCWFIIFGDLMFPKIMSCTWNINQVGPLLSQVKNTTSDGGKGLLDATFGPPRPVVNHHFFDAVVRGLSWKN